MSEGLNESHPKAFRDDDEKPRSLGAMPKLIIFTSSSAMFSCNEGTGSIVINYNKRQAVAGPHGAMDTGKRKAQKGGPVKVRVLLFLVLSCDFDLQTIFE